jgi:REP element-mobilizing transposase RayT
MEGFYHVWFSTKGRLPILEDEIASETARMLRDIARKAEIRLLEAEAVADHAHALIELRHPQTLSRCHASAKGSQRTLSPPQVSRSRNRYAARLILAEGLWLA